MTEHDDALEPEPARGTLPGEDPNTAEGGHHAAETPGADAESPRAVTPLEGDAGEVDAVGEDSEPAAPTEQPAMHRRAPRYGRFMTIGIMLGGVFAFVGALLSAGQSEYMSKDIFWVLVLWFCPLGLFLGAITALAIDRRSIKKADRQLDAETR
ncbi:hypothetical protein SAMN06298212_13217 [Ruaniaceae bacterium KH17]|nr:hypothetical protein SAMN06298212_13217 [Ruaniaceae bacterium KH17]